MAALVKTELDPESFANGEGNDIAERLALTIKLTDLKDGVEYNQKLTEILERAGRHPIVSFELNKLK